MSEEGNGVQTGVEYGDKPAEREACRSAKRLLLLLDHLLTLGSPSEIVGVLHEMGSAAYEESGRILKEFEDVMD